MKLLGRIFLIAAAVLLFVGAVPQLIEAIKAMNVIGWQNTFTQFGEAFPHLFSILFAVIFIGYGLRAVFGAIRGKKSFGLAISAFILMIFPTVIIVLGIMGNMAGTWDFWAKVIGGFLAPILYFLGFLFI